MKIQIYTTGNRHFTFLSMQMLDKKPEEEQEAAVEEEQAEYEA